MTWDGPNDPTNPKNWAYSLKWTATIVVSSYTLISMMSASIVAPTLVSLGADLGINSQFEGSLVLSIFVLAYAFGPFFIGPLSEVYGRVRVLQLATLFFLIFNTACGFAKTSSQMFAFRFLAGLGGRSVYSAIPSLKGENQLTSDKCAIHHWRRSTGRLLDCRRAW